jgi:hypothetical protein
MLDEDTGEAFERTEYGAMSQASSEPTRFSGRVDNLMTMSSNPKSR